jgi:hypothetical protein
MMVTSGASDAQVTAVSDPDRLGEVAAAELAAFDTDKDEPVGPLPAKVSRCRRSSGMISPGRITPTGSARRLATHVLASATPPFAECIRLLPL